MKLSFIISPASSEVFSSECYIIVKTKKATKTIKIRKNEISK